MGLRSPVATASAVICGVLLTACGGDNGERGGPAAASAPPAPQPQSRGPLAIPRSVPLRESTTGDPVAIKVIRLWSEALRRGDVERASSFWAVPSKVQNVTPVLTLASAAQVRRFNRSLPCGAMLTSGLGARNGFTIAVFALTRRPGADCGSGTGHHARTAIRVRGAKITDWYRLPDDFSGPPSPQPPVAPVQPGGPIV